jgi:hypothetical protein
MVKDQHPQGAKEAAGNVLPAWLDAFKVLLDLDPQQDVSGEHWDGLEIRIQIFRVRTTRLIFSWLFSDPGGKNRPSTRYRRLFRAFSPHTCPLTLPLPYTTSTCSIQHTCSIISQIAGRFQIHPRARRSSCTSLLRPSSIF